MDKAEKVFSKIAKEYSLKTVGGVTGGAIATPFAIRRYRHLKKWYDTGQETKLVKKILDRRANLLEFLGMPKAETRRGFRVAVVGDPKGLRGIRGGVASNVALAVLGGALAGRMIRRKKEK